MRLEWPDLIFPPINLYSMAYSKYNDHTGDKLVSKKTTEEYRKEYDRIFHGNKGSEKFEKVTIGGNNTYKLKVN